MGWNVSHGADGNGEIRRSYASVHNLAQQMAHVLTASDWRSIAHVFNRPSADAFTVAATDARHIADVLMRAANLSLMPRDWQVGAEAFALAAARAADTGEPWTWR